MKHGKLFTALGLGFLVCLSGGVRDASGAADVPFYAQNAVRPNVLIILDRSGSMAWKPDNSADGSTCTTPFVDCLYGADESKISIARRVLAGLLDDDNSSSVVSPTDDDSLEIRLGYMRYYNGCDLLGDPKDYRNQIPLYSGARQDVGRNFAYLFPSTATADASTMNDLAENSATPLAASLKEALTYFTSDAVITGDAAKACRKNYVIVVTDGEDTCEGCATVAGRRAASVDAAAALRASPTVEGVYVVGLGAGETGIPTYLKNTLNWMAYYGAPYFGSPPAFVDPNPYVANVDTGSYTTGAGCSSAVDPGAQTKSGYAFIAASANELTTALKTALGQIKAGSYTRSAPVVAQNGGRLYLGFFDMPNWRGRLQAFKVDSAGTVDTSAPVFDSGDQLRTVGRGTVYTAPVGGGGCTPVAGGPITFADTTSALYSSGQCGKIVGGDGTNYQEINSVAPANEDDAKAVINFVLNPNYSSDKYVGVRTPASHPLYSGWKLGDIVHSTPVVVGPPGQLYTFDSYAAFRDAPANKNRETIIYVNANDGMLHALQASGSGYPTYDFATKTWNYGAGETGNEKWAYVPNAILGKLKDLRTDHRYLVDGTPTVADVCLGSPTCTWKTVLISGLRGGGQKYFALDVTNPASPTVLWEKGDAQMGYTWSKPAIGRIATSGGKYKWVAFVGGGVPTSGDAKIYAINIEGGGIEAGATITNLTGADDTTGTTNGVVGTIRAAGKGYGITDTVFFGDLEGKLWRWDVSAENSTKWELAVLYDPFSAGGGGLGTGNRRPIYNAPSVALATTATGSNYYVAFGTGNESDTEEGDLVPQNYFFLVKDPNQPDPKNTADFVSGELVWRTGIKGVAAMEPGEKNIGDPVIFYGNVFFTTYVPNPDICSIGTSYLWQVALTETSVGSATYSDTKTAVGSGLPSGPVIITTPESGSKVIVATSAGGSTGGSLIKDMGSGGGPSTAVQVESWREAF